MVGDNPRCEDTLRFHVVSAAVCALWLAHEPAHPLPTFSLRTVVICRLFSSHEETSEIPLSSSIVLRRFPPISDDRETTRSILVRDALPSWENALPLRRRESAFSHRYSILRKGVCFLVRPPVQIIGCKPGATWIGLIICATKHVALSVAANIHARQYRRKVSARTRRQHMVPIQYQQNGQSFPRAVEGANGEDGRARKQ